MSFWRAMARGFTLIEMAIVLVVIGLILSGGLMAVTPVLQNSRATETNAKMDRIEQALIVYAAQYSCLPCPATGSLATGTANYGQARGSGGYYSTSCPSSGTCVVTDGVVPWLNLGLSEDDITDAWGNRISYQVGADATVTTCTGNTTGTRSTTLNLSGSFARSSTVTTCYPRGNIRINNTSGTALITGGASAEGAAYVLVSHGSDGLGAWQAQTGAAKAAASGNQADNADDATPFVQDNRIEVNASYFDDIVRWRTAPMIIQLCGTNSCGNPA